MRIRKRQVPFPVSDPNLINRSPVVVQLNDATTTSPKQPFATAPPIPLSDPPQPSDQHHLLPPIGKPTDGCDDSSGGAHGRHHKKQQCLVVEDGGGQEGGGGQKGNDTRKGGILSSEMPSEVFPPSSPSSSKQGADWRWCEGEKAFPPKKRRGMSFENAKIENNNNDSNDNDSKKKMKSRKSRMKAKMNKKYCYDSNEGEDDNKEEETKPDVNVNVNVGGGKNKKVRGGALMEGSRCSRVNGRGWRCCQPTLVGYSLCEHHLGKGRLRSMTSVRSRSSPKNNNNNNNNNHPQEQHMPTNGDGNGKDNDIDIEEKKKVKPVVVTTKKRMKLGMVKARSMSSLLGQTNTDNIAVAENNNK